MALIISESETFINFCLTYQHSLLRVIHQELGYVHVFEGNIMGILLSKMQSQVNPEWEKKWQGMRGVQIRTMMGVDDYW